MRLGVSRDGDVTQVRGPPLQEAQRDVDVAALEFPLRLDRDVDVALVGVDLLQVVQRLEVLVLLEHAPLLQEHVVRHRHVVQHRVAVPADVADVVLLALGDVDGDRQPLPVVAEPQVRVADLGVQEALVAAIGDDPLLVLLELLLLEGPALQEPLRALLHGPAQAARGQPRQPRELDGGDLDLAALPDRDHDVLEIARIDRRRVGVDLDVVVALLVVEVAQGLQLAPDHGRVRELADRQRERLPQVLLLDLVVAPEVHAAHARELAQVDDDVHAVGRFLPVEVDIGELAGREELADGFARRVGRQRIARGQAGPGPDLGGADRHGAHHVHGRDRRRIGQRRARQQRQEAAQHESGRAQAHRADQVRQGAPHRRVGVDRGSAAWAAAV